MFVIQTGVTLFDYGAEPLGLTQATSTSITPTKGAVGTTITATVLGSFFSVASGTTFSLTSSFGPGITVSSINIVSGFKATMTLTISATAVLGLYDLTTTNFAGTQILHGAFSVLLPIQLFPISGLDVRNMALLGTSATQALYYDYGNTECFYILVQTGSPWSSGFDTKGFGPLLPPVLYAVSPQFANNWFGNQAPSVTYDPFSFNPTFPLSNL